MAKTITLGVRLEESEAAVFQAWCKKKGMTTSQMLAYIVECVLKAQSDVALNNDNLRSLMQVWDSFCRPDQVGSVLNSKGKAEVVETIYIFSEEGKQPSLAVLSEPSFFGKNKLTTNTEEILDEILGVFSRILRKRLRRVSARLDTNTLMETISALIDYYEGNEDEDENYIRELFSDNERSIYGRIPETIQYVRHNRPSLKERGQLDMFPKMREEEGKEDEP